MYTITKTFTFCYGHRLYKDPGKCGYLHGHTAKAEITLSGRTLNALGMLKNFDTIKESVGKWIDENLDHHTLLNGKDPLVKALKKEGQKLFVIDGNPTAENLAKILFHITAKKDLPVVKVTVWESPTAFATYE